MTQQLKVALFALLAGGVMLLAPAARADEWDKQTTVTFNEPVEVPGKVLPAGTYVFKLADSDSDRNIVQIFSEDQKHLLGTVMAIPDYRDEPADHTVITFEERPWGKPEAVHSWFYPGETEGVQFVYPKSERQFAAQSEQPTPERPAPPAPVAPVSQTANSQAQPSEAQPAVVVEEEEIDVTAQEAPVQPVESDSVDGLQMLPQTAGNFAMIPLIGVMLLSGGFTAIRLARKLT